MIKVGDIVTNGKDESMITAVRYSSNNFYAFGRWFPFSYIGYTMKIKRKAKDD